MTKRATLQPRRREENPIVFLDIVIGEQDAQRMLIEYLVTWSGPRAIKLRADVVPRTAENFRLLCTGETQHPVTGQRRHYAHCPFQRVVKNRFCQSGDYLNHDGSGGECAFEMPSDEQPLRDMNTKPSCTALDPGQSDGAGTDRITTFADENYILRHVGPGVLSMVNTGPDTNASQFYLHFAENADLDDKHVVFGSLLGAASLRVLHTIHSVATSRGDPKAPVYIAHCGQLQLHE